VEPLKEWDNIPQATISLNNSVKEMCWVVWGKRWSHLILTGHLNPALNNAYLYSQSCEIHRLGPFEFVSVDWFPYEQ
jgi:hypothetical protein